MRLTLRTLLAYMDDFLEQEDREDIAEKLKHNEQATALLERIREVVSRARLGAPQIIGSGMARDPNSVAEYLESTLAPEQVKLLESICLESDVHLAEVGAVHHIVTMILSEPAHVDPASRQRMYGLIDQPAASKAIEPTAAAVAVAEPAPLAEAVDGTARSTVTGPQAGPDDDAALERRKPEVPEYLRSSSAASWKAIVLTLIGAALATAVVLGALYPDRVLGPLGYNKPSAPQPPAPVTPHGPGSPTPKAVNQGTADKQPAGISQVPPSEAPPAEPAQEVPAQKPSKPPEKEPAAPVPPVPAPPTQPVHQPTGAGDKEPKIVAVPLPVNPAPVVPVPVDPKLPSDAKGPDQVAKGDSKEPKPEPAKPAAPAAIGRNLTPDQILLRGSASGEGWERLAGSTSFVVGDKLLVLPAFRPLISVGGVSLQLDGPAQLSVGNPGADGLPEVTVHFGRVVVRSLGQPNARVRLNTGSAAGVLTIQDADATVGGDVRLVHPPGTDPTQVPPMRHVDFYAARGKAEWTAEGGSPIELSAPQRLIMDNGAARPGPGAAPAWILSSQISALDERATRRIHEGLPPDRSVKLSLTELLLQPQFEVRNLAARCSAYIDHFDPLVVGLSDEDQRAGWATLVSELQAAVARDPKTAVAVREALVLRRREKAPDLFRMLWGYTPLGLKNGDARRLVDTLDHDDLDFRVLAFMNLQEITGMGLYYRPEYNATKRKPSLMRWQKRLDEGKITFASGAQ